MAKAKKENLVSYKEYGRLHSTKGNVISGQCVYYYVKSGRLTGIPIGDKMFVDKKAEVKPSKKQFDLLRKKEREVLILKRKLNTK